MDFLVHHEFGLNQKPMIFENLVVNILTLKLIMVGSMVKLLSVCCN